MSSDERLRAAALDAAPSKTPFDFVERLRMAQGQVMSSPLYRKFIDGTPLENDIAVWMTTFAAQAVRDCVALAPSDGPTERTSLVDEILDSLRSGYLFGNHDEPLDAASRRILRVIQQRLT